MVTKFFIIIFAAISMFIEHINVPFKCQAIELLTQFQSDLIERDAIYIQSDEKLNKIISNHHETVT